MENQPGKIFEGKLLAQGLRIGIVCSRFNEFFVGKLLQGAMDAVVRHGGNAQDLDVAWVPGSYELPFAVSKMLKKGSYDAVIALGVVIQGATTHASQINNQVSKALGELGIQSGTPVIYGLVTTENIEQAIERSGTKAGNRGFDVAVSAIEMANLNKEFQK